MHAVEVERDAAAGRRLLAQGLLERLDRHGTARARSHSLPAQERQVREIEVADRHPSIVVSRVSTITGAAAAPARETRLATRSLDVLERSWNECGALPSPE